MKRQRRPHEPGMSIIMKNRKTRAKHRSQSGFAIMMVIFLATVMLISAMVAAPYIRTERQREKEQEMIWRGNQYVRGIKLYYRKTGHFPTSVDDLTKPKLGSLRFMRQAYKDPMNKEDGAWRFIYVGPAGQLIGSLKPPQTLQLPGQPGAAAIGTSAAGANQQQAVSFGASGFGQSPPQTGSQPGQPGATTQAGPNAAQPGAAAQGGNATANDDANAANATPSGLLSADSSLVGGNIIGVGSKINKRSVIIYDKAKNYRLFEFIWNPSKDMANAINQQIGAPAQNPQGTGQGQSGFGQTGFGQQSGFGQRNNSPTTPPQTPPTEIPTPTPPPNPN
jgi:hypothetical protein